MAGQSAGLGFNILSCDEGVFIFISRAVVAIQREDIVRSLTGAGGGQDREQQLRSSWGSSIPPFEEAPGFQAIWWPCESSSIHRRIGAGTGAKKGGHLTIYSLQGGCLRRDRLTPFALSVSLVIGPPCQPRVQGGPSVRHLRGLRGSGAAWRSFVLSQAAGKVRS